MNFFRSIPPRKILIFGKIFISGQVPVLCPWKIKFLICESTELFAFLKSVKVQFIPQQDSIACYQTFKIVTVRYRWRSHVTNLWSFAMAKDIFLFMIFFLFFRLNYFLKWSNVKSFAQLFSLVTVDFKIGVLKYTVRLHHRQ